MIIAIIRPVRIFSVAARFLRCSGAWSASYCARANTIKVTYYDASFAIVVVAVIATRLVARYILHLTLHAPVFPPAKISLIKLTVKA